MQPDPDVSSPSSPEDARPSRIAKAKPYFYLIASIIGAVVLFIFAVHALGKVGDALLTLFISLLIVFILRRPVAWLERHRVSRSWGSIISILLLVAVLFLLGLLLFPPLVTQFNTFVSNLPSYLQQVVGWGEDLSSTYGDLSDSPQAREWLSGVLSSFAGWFSSFTQEGVQYLIRFGTRAGAVLLIFFLALMASFWFLRDLPRMSAEVNLLVRKRHADDFHAVVAICSRIGDGYLKGLLITAVCSGVLSGFGFALVGVPYAGILGAITGVFSIVPILGPWIAGVAAAVVALFVSPVTCLLSVIITVVVRLLTDSVIQPKVMSTTIDLHPSLVIVAVIAGQSLGGVVGMILAVPVTAMVVNVYAYFHEKHTGTSLMSENGALFRGRPFSTVFQSAEPASEVAEPDVQTRASDDEPSA